MLYDIKPTKGKTMNQAELIETIARQASRHYEAGVSKTIVTAVLKTQAEVATQALQSREEVVLPGLGKLSTSVRAARTGRNPQTGEAVEIPEKRVAKFSAVKALKDAVA